MTEAISKYVLLVVVAGTFIACSSEEEVPTTLSVAPASLQALHEEVTPADAAAVDTVADEFITSPSYVGEVDFPHLMHVEDIGLDCEECHHETDAGALDLPRDHEDMMADFWIDCSTCHHPSGEVSLPAQACSNCHPSQPRDIADETLSAKVVIHQNCWECHDAGTGAEASESCETCHYGDKKEF